MKLIKDHELSKFGINVKHEQMDNGELRFRLTSIDGSGYIRTVAGKNGAWQNSHAHHNIGETYIVQSCWMALAQLINNKIKITVYQPGDIVTIDKNIIHNVYLPKGAVTHTIKHGTTTDTDWIACEEFDEQTKVLSEQDIFQSSKEDRGQFGGHRMSLKSRTKEELARELRREREKIERDRLLEE